MERRRCHHTGSSDEYNASEKTECNVLWEVKDPKTVSQFLPHTNPDFRQV